MADEKKPHPLSKEGRALREAKKLEEVISTPTEQESSPVVTESKEETNGMTYVLEEIAKLKAENEEMKARLVHPGVKGKERDKGPKLFSYKMRGGVPVLSYESFRQDPRKDFVFKNQFGQYESNHWLRLSLANGETTEVEVTEFNRDFTRSDKMTAKDQYGNVIYDENLKTAKSFTFEDNGLTFTVLLNSIN